jgi:transposase
MDKVVVAAEACSGSAAFLDALHRESGLAVKLCHPGYAQRMRHNPDKTDKSDSELIADLNRVGYLPEVYLAPEEIRDLRSLVRYRNVQVEESRAVKLRIRALLRHNRIYGTCSFWTKEGLQWLSGIQELPQHSKWVLSRYLIKLSAVTNELGAVTARLNDIVKKDQLCQALLKHRGIGVITAAILRAEIGTFQRFRTGKQLARFCGLTPCNRSSGNKVADSGLVRAGNPVLKACLIQAGWILIRHDPHWKQFAAHLAAAGKPKSVICAAVVNRWLRKLFHAVKHL